MNLFCHCVIRFSVWYLMFSEVTFGFRKSDNMRKNANRNFLVKTDLGQIQGKKVNLQNEELKYVVQYLGIPYAEPPIGNLRWKKPVPIARIVADEEVYDATRFRAVCPQPLSNSLLPNVLLPVWYDASSDFMRNRTSNMSENCLHLNIYVPAAFHEHQGNSPHEVERLPVMVYFHGHTYSEGSGSFYDGSVLANYGKVVVVTFNYRLGALGFLSGLDENLPGNYGLWDQIEVLRWIKKCIWNFGGNPSKVTAFGSGAGAASIELLTLSFHTKSYFKRAILQSGSAIAPWAVVRNPRKYAKALANSPNINCPTNSSSLMVNCLRGVEWRALVTTKVTPTPFDLAFGPVVDGGSKLLSDFPINLLRKGEFTNYDLMLGISKAAGFGYVRDRLKACKSCRMSDKSVPYFASKALYKTVNFNYDLASFVHAFYGSNDDSLIEQIVNYLYRDWTSPNNSTSLKKSLMQLYTDRQWVEPAVKKADIQASFYHPAFFYTFSHYPGSDADRSWVECALGEEIPFVFGAPFFYDGFDLFPYNYTATDAMISLAVITYWSNFASNGNPMNGQHQQTTYLGQMINRFQPLTWPRYDVTTRPYLDISSHPGIYNHYRAEKVAFWRRFLPRLTGLPKLEYAKKPNTFSRINSYEFGVTNSKSNEDSFSSRHGSGKSGEGPEKNAMDLQLSMTLAVGFVLLFVNIVAFAIVSYHKEKDKYKIEKLQSQLKDCRKKLSMNHRSNGVPKSSSDQRVSERRADQIQDEVKEKRRRVNGFSSNDFTTPPALVKLPLSKNSDLTPLLTSAKAFSESNRDPPSFQSIYPHSKPSNDSAHYSKAKSASSLISPQQSDGHMMNGYTRNQNENAFNNNKIPNPAENEKIYWSRSELFEGEAGSTSKVTFGPSHITTTLPKNVFVAPMAASSSNGHGQKQKPRCRSAMGMYPPQEGDYGSILKREYHHNSFRHRNLAERMEQENRCNPLTRADTRPYYHGSVQYLPYYHSREFSTHSNDPFTIPRPTTVTENTAAMKQCSQAKLTQKRKPAVGNDQPAKKNSAAFKAVTTKL